MLPLWVWLSMGAVVLAVGGTLFDKYLLEKYFGSRAKEEEAGPGALLLFSTYFSGVILAGLLLFGHEDMVMNRNASQYALLAGGLNASWILLYLHAINRSEMSRVVPLFQTIPLFGLVLAFITLGETLSITQLWSVAFMLLGALVLMHERSGSYFKLDVKTLLLMLGSSFMVALSQTTFKVATTYSNYITATIWLWLGFLLFGVVLHICITKYRLEFNYMLKERLRNVLTLNSFNEVFDNLGELVLFAAVMIGPIALVQSLGVYEPLLIFVVSIILVKFGSTYLHEDISKPVLFQKSVGIVLILIGSLILYSAL